MINEYGVKVLKEYILDYVPEKYETVLIKMIDELNSEKVVDISASPASSDGKP